MGGWGADSPFQAGADSEAEIAVVVKGWPRLSETFIAQEIVGLEARGVRQLIVSLRHPTDAQVHDIHRRVRAPVGYLPEYLHDEPIRVLRAVRWCRRNCPGWRAALRMWGRDVRRDPTRNRVRRFGQACVLAASLGSSVRWLHAHFLHTPASVTRYAAQLTGLPWSFSAHAKDIWTTPDWDLTDKLAETVWGVTCTAAGLRRLQRLSPTPERVSLLYHGLSFDRFPQSISTPSDRRGDDLSVPVRLLTVGRAVEKKGFDLLLRALAMLPADLHWRLRHIGGGAGLKSLKAQSRGLGLDDRVEWSGPCAHDTVLAAYAAADLFVLPCRQSQDGDRDGLPNVLLEAQLMGLACLSTRAAAVPELIVDGETGLLVPPDDAAALAEGLARLTSDPELRKQLGAAGRALVHRDFDASPNLDRLADVFHASLTGARPQAA